MTDLDGRTAFVTGGSQGIGREIALTLAAEGANVAVAARGDGIHETADAIGDRALPVRTDVTDEDSVRSSIEEAADAFGGLDVLVNNAGIGLTGTVESTSLEEWHRLLAINLNGVVYGTRAAMPHLRASAGSVLNVASVFGLVGGPETAAYATAKGAVVNFTRTTAVDYAEAGVRVNSICPGFVETEMTRSELSDDAFYEFVSTQTPMGRIAEPEEIAEPAAFIVSEKASYITGVNLSIDGGWTTH